LNCTVGMVELPRGSDGVGPVVCRSGWRSEFSSAHVKRASKRSAAAPQASSMRSRPAKKRVIKGAVGLENLGNTCFMNSGLQCLCFTHALQKYFRHHRHIVAKDTSTPAGRLAAALCELFERHWGKPGLTETARHGPFAPQDVLKAIQQLNPIFAEYQQQDSQELLRFILDCLHEELRSEVPVEVPSWVQQSPVSESSTSTQKETSQQSSQETGQQTNGGSSVPSWSLCAGSDSAADDMGEITLPEPVIVSCSSDELSANSEACAESGAGPAPGSSPSTSPPTRITSIVSEVFQGRQVSSVRCLECGHTSRTVEPFFDLSVPIPNTPQESAAGEESAHASSSSRASPVSYGSGGWLNGLKLVGGFVKNLIGSDPHASEVIDCVRKYCQPELLTGREAYECDKCRTKRDAEKRYTIQQLPEVLCIHLKRFRCDGGWLTGTKNSKPVTVPTDEVLDLSDFVDPSVSSEGAQYQLYAFVQHIGSLGSGHYISYARHRKKNRWIEFDDSRVRECTVDEVREAEPYVLFFQRIPPEDAAPSRLDLREDRLSAVDQLPRLSDSGQEACSMQNLNGILERFVAPDVAFVSRRWYVRFTTMCQPGPIDNYLHVCPHRKLGAIDDSWCQQNFVPVSADLCAALIHEFGGGPVLSRLEKCTKCCDWIVAYNKRKEVEFELINKYDTKELGGKVGDHWYLVHNAWVNNWKRYVRSPKAVHIHHIKGPGKISNDRLFHRPDPAGPSVVKPNLRLRQDFAGVNAVVWSVLHYMHGGGPPICRQDLSLTSQEMPSEGHVLPEELKLQADQPSAGVSSLDRLGWRFVDGCQGDTDAFLSKQVVEVDAAGDKQVDVMPAANEAPAADGL